MMAGETEVEPISMDARIIVCPCGGKNFEISLSNGMDGRTYSIWLKCAKCKASRGMRKVMRQIEQQKED